MFEVNLVKYKELQENYKNAIHLSFITHLIRDTLIQHDH